MIVWRTKYFRMQNPSEDFNSLNDPRPGAAEIRSRIGGPDFATPYRRQIVPAFRQARAWQLPQDFFFVKAARNQHDHFRRVFANLFSGGGDAALPSFSKHVSA